MHGRGDLCDLDPIHVDMGGLGLDKVCYSHLAMRVASVGGRCFKEFVLSCLSQLKFS